MQNLNIPAIPQATETELPPALDQAFEDTVSQYGQILAPGAKAKLRSQTMRAYLNREIYTADAVTAKLTGFLLGDDHRAAREKGDAAAAKASDPRPFFLDGQKPEGDAPIRAVLKHLGNIRPESREALEAELADKTFGRTHREIAEAVLAHVRKRDNHHHLVTQPTLPYGETKVRQALDPWRSHLAAGVYEELSRKWGPHLGNDLPQHLVNLRVAEQLAQKDSGRYFRDGQPIAKINYQDPDYHPQKPDAQQQGIMDEMAKAYGAEGL